ncbi:MAG: tryptophan-rich sensory protein [Henriciella sp.]|nr:tryptophan-rich sensory protein [Henriciella sp.]
MITFVIASLTAATAGLGAVVSSKALDIWYLALDKPELTPPGYVFSIVWPILFVLMALAAVLVRIKAGSFAACSGALGLYFTQLALNLSWSWMFFGFQEVLLSMVVLVVLWLLILATMRAFSKFSTAATLMLLPYLIWVSFAGYLNGSILFLN